MIDERPLVAAGGPSVYFVDYGLSEKYDPNVGLYFKTIKLSI